MSSSREKILNAIKNNNVVKEVPLRDDYDFGITYEDKIAKFQEVIATVGGEAIVTTKEDLDEVIKGLYPDAKSIVSNVDFCKLGNIDANEQDLPHNLKDVNLSVVKGNFAIAENGSVWMKNEDNRHRSLYFISENLIIVIDKNDIVNNMHEAYERISFAQKGYGTFISGPSKTADIEQSLVIGAHGPKSGYVLFV